MPAGPALELHGIAKMYGRTAALKRVDLVLDPGATLVVLGPNGSGKTTLLKIVAGSITPTMGGGSVFGRDFLRERHALRSDVGMLAAESYLYDDLSAQENLRFILTVAGRKPQEAELAAALDTVGLAGRAGERVRSFSSGMKRRLALARLLLLQPKLLLLDEPYNALDAAGSELVDELVRGAARESKATVLATHDAERGLALADAVLELERGAVTYCGAAAAYGARHAHRVG